MDTTPLHVEDYDFSISGVIKAAFEQIKGVKWIFMVAVLAYAVISTIASVVLGLVFPTDPANPGVNDFIVAILSLPITTPLIVGIFMFGVKRARGEELQLNDLFSYFVIVWPLMLALIVMDIMILLGFVLLIIPGIYLSIAYTFTLPLVADKGLGFWEAMELSRKAVSKRWFKFFFFALAAMLIVIISAIPLGIGLIWTIPMIYVAYGLLYHRIFDEEKPQTADAFESEPIVETAEHE